MGLELRDLSKHFTVKHRSRQGDRARGGEA